MTTTSRPTSSKNMFALTKYSRALYRQQDGLQSTQDWNGDCGWQHHTQPSLRLLLEVRKSSQGVPEQMRVRIVWTVPIGQAPIATGMAPLQQENVIFEDVDLLLIRKHIHPFPTQGMPLKAVFRDTMVGIRFLPPQAKSNNLSEYRRFQITFQSTGDSAAFIDAIRDVCPCKPSPINNPGPSVGSSRSALNRLPRSETGQGTQQPQAPFQSQLQSHVFQAPSGARAGSNLTRFSDEGITTLPPPSQPSIVSDLPVDFAVPFHQSCQNNSVASSDARSHAYQSTTVLTQHYHESPVQESTQMDLSSGSSNPFCPQALQQSGAQLHSRQPSIPIYGLTRQNSEIILGSNPNASVAIPTPPTSSQGPSLQARRIASAIPSARTPLSNENADTDAISTTTTKCSLLESMYEACKLDHLAPNDLEQIVAHVVREDGFAELLQKIDSLWQLKAIVDL